MSNGRGFKGRGGPGRGHSGRGSKTENNNKDLQFGGTQASTSKFGIPTLTQSSNSDDVTRFFERCLIYAAEQYETGEMERMCDPTKRYDPAEGDPPRYPQATDEENGLVPNPDFVEDQPEGPDNRRDIIGLVRKYEVRNGRLTSEGERRLNSDTRYFEKKLEQWTNRIEKLGREKRKFHSIICNHLTEGAKGLLKSNFGKSGVSRPESERPSRN
jgi:hypothetical protein